MRDNFRPYLRLTTNILVVIGTFLIAFNLDRLNLEQDKNIKQRKIDCSDVTSGVIAYKDFLKKYNLGMFDDKRQKLKKDELLAEFCQFYMF